ncbi:MAG TPA: hypothetical protein VK206_26220 [Anaerolineales bacterium]|nr:hypothetical protein [Anaerolineales bacterium]
MNKETLLKRIDELSAISGARNDGFEARIQEMFHGALDIMVVLYGPSSVQLQNFLKEEESIRGKYAGEGGAGLRGQLTRGVLKNLKAAIETGIIESVQKSITGEVLSDFLQLARTVFDEKGDSANNVASVLAAALFEDTLRRIAMLNGIPHIDKLQDVITELKNKSLLKGSQVGIANSYLNFRNNALHAQWDKIERESVASVLGFSEQLLLKEIA